MALVHDASRAVSVQEVDCQEEGVREEVESRVSFNEKVEKIRSHKPFDLRLDVDGVDIGQCFNLLRESAMVTDDLMICKISRLPPYVACDLEYRLDTPQQ